MQNSDNIHNARIAALCDKILHLFMSIFLIFVFIFPVNIIPASAQLTELGFEAGAFNYTGDLNKYYTLANHRPAAGIFLRSNLNQVASLRYGLIGGMLAGADHYSQDPFNIARGQSFKIYLIEISGLLEFYFLDYKSKNSRVHWTPYLNFGAGVFTFFGDQPENEKYSKIQPVIPIGFGIKYQLSKKFDIGIESSIRLTFFDYLDGVSSNKGLDKNYNYGNIYDFDTYYFIGITLNYTFYFIPCPFDYN